MGCCDQFSKYIIFFTNLVFFLASLGLIGIGAYLEIALKTYLDFVGNPYLNTSIALIVIGVIMLIISFFGCLGAIKENKCMILTYATFITLITVALIGVAVVIGVFHNQVKTEVERNMVDAMKNYGKDGHEGVTNTWGYAQKTLRCCGVKGYKDWNEVLTAGDVPETCCKSPETNCGKGIGKESESEARNTIYTMGCVDKVQEYVTEYSGPSIGVGVGVVVLLLISIVMSCCYGARVGQRYNYV